MKRLLLVAAIALFSCADESGARNALTSAGFTEIQLQGYDFFACGKGDDFATKFTASNVRGQKISGVVCCGIVKGCTIRY